MHLFFFVCVIHSHSSIVVVLDVRILFDLLMPTIQLALNDYPTNQRYSDLAKGNLNAYQYDYNHVDLKVGTFIITEEQIVQSLH